MRDDYQPIILIGAARSGTKLIRDLIAEHPAVDKVPYDVNYIWRLGNEHIPHDELTVELLTPQIRQRILKRLEGFRSDAPFLIEKTVSNCLRVPYVHAVFPNARFIHLVRNGWDVIESAYRQWTASPDWSYIFKKARTFPLDEAYEYALSYAKSVLLKWIMRGKPTSTWGPRYAGIDEDLASKQLVEVCAIQWVKSVERALKGLAALPEDQVLTIRYEEFVKRPYTHLKMLAQFINIDSTPYLKSDKLAMISRKNVGKGLRNFSAEERALIWPHIEHALASLGYSPNLAVVTDT